MLHVQLVLLSAIVYVLCGDTLQVISASDVNFTVCSLKTMRMKIYDVGCDVKKIKTIGCQGHCKSSSMYLLNNQDMQTHCQFCKVSKYRIRFVHLNCPLLQNSVKVIPYREATSCECQPCL